MFAQFPFLLDPPSKKTVTWTAYCKKVLILKKDGRYEIVFNPKGVPTEASVGQQNGSAPLVGAGDSVAASAAAVGAEAVAPAVAPAETAGGRAAGGAGAPTGESEGAQEPEEESDDDAEVGHAAATVAHAGHQVRASAARRSIPPAAPVGPVGEEGGAAEEDSEAVGRSAGAVSMTSSGGRPLAGAGDPPARPVVRLQLQRTVVMRQTLRWPTCLKTTRTPLCLSSPRCHTRCRGTSSQRWRSPRLGEPQRTTRRLSGRLLLDLRLRVSHWFARLQAAWT